jgi:hypothetical protein
LKKSPGTERPNDAVRVALEHVSNRFGNRIYGLL